MAIVPRIVLGFVDFTSSAVNLGLELDSGSASHEKLAYHRQGVSKVGPTRLPDLLEDWDRIRLGGAQYRNALNFRDFERSTLVHSRELRLREADWFYKGKRREKDDTPDRLTMTDATHTGRKLAPEVYRERRLLSFPRWRGENPEILLGRCA